MSYSTKQKRDILDLIKKLDKDFTAKDIYNDFGGKIGLTTIYRYVESLEKDGTILRVSMGDKMARFQYVEPCNNADHFYLKCEKCGSLEHVECEKTRGLTEHILKNHHFIPTDTKLIINGFCAKCAKGGE